MTTDLSAASRAVCVLGFGRSGTSLVTRVLSLLGVDLGPEADLLPPAEIDNPRGYWEPSWMIELNDEILSRLGGPWWEPFSAAPGWERSPELDPLRKRARRMLAEKYEGRALWGWKDPRTTYTLPFWRELVPSEMSFVVCMRNPVDAVASMQRRPEPTLSVRAWGELWLEYTARALLQTRGDRRLIVFYEDCFGDGTAIERLGAFIGLEGDELTERVGVARNAVQQDLQRHATTLGELAADPGIPPEARTLFLALRAAEQLRQRSGDASEDAMQLSAAIERVAPDLWWVNRQAAQADSRVADAAREREEWARLRREGDERNAAAGRELAALRRAVVDLERRIREADDRARAAEERAADEATARAVVETSTSWRMTRPLRLAAKYARERR